MRIKNTTLAILWPIIFVGSVALAAAGDRYFSNPTLNKDVVIQVNKAGVTTDAVKAVGATGAVTLGPSTGNVSHQVIGKEAVVGTDTGEGLRFNFLNAAGGNKAALLVGGYSPSANNAYAWLGSYENGVGPAAMKFASYTTEVGGYSKTGAWTLGGSGGNQTHILNGVVRHVTDTSANFTVQSGSSGAAMFMYAVTSTVSQSCDTTCANTRPTAAAVGSGACYRAWNSSTNPIACTSAGGSQYCMCAAIP